MSCAQLSGHRLRHRSRGLVGAGGDSSRCHDALIQTHLRTGCLRKTPGCGPQTRPATAGIAEPSKWRNLEASVVADRATAFHLRLAFVARDVNRYASKPIVLEGDNWERWSYRHCRSFELAGWWDVWSGVDLDASEEPDRIVLPGGR